MAFASFRFADFELDPGNRQLRRAGVPVEVNGRYLDALTLLVREPGQLVTKTRFMDEVWRGVPVTDEALTQCVRSLRKLLGDDANRPTFIETVPKHGYRFIAQVSTGEAALAGAAAPPDLPLWLRRGFAGTAGGGVAGLLGGLFYGFAASQPEGAAIGSFSAILVLLCVTGVTALLGAAGVSFGIALARPDTAEVSARTVLGAALGGMVVGAFVKLIGLDAFALLFGQAPADITGAAEGLLLGFSVGVATWVAAGPLRGSVQRAVGAAAVIGGVGGAAVPLLGGRMMGGSLDLLSRTFPQSRLRLDALGALFGEPGFGRVPQVATGALEGALFTACVVGAMMLAARPRS